ncbi:hypothetical protein N7495_002865 [Penicillium taxi]|uniref:uncharacterized protein n=1 Tax=Penicillium taxi TaxID=168475 RepID=UPI0025455774|nr:uncharacterized protein N7495_002865 [Penicillium taxi]KAJ5902337.1 hypothetical protein N7495_002865 [Penicillium taxi]
MSDIMTQKSNMTKTILVMTVTGNQGSSVANVFLDKPGWKVKGLTRDPSSPASQALRARGVQMIKGDVNDVDSLKAAFQGVDIIFGNTVFSDAMSNSNSPDLSFLKPGQNAREMSYDLELLQGKNIANAAASVVPTLDRFIWSSLSDAAKWSKGRYTGVYHFDCKAHVVDYIHEMHTELAEKTSILQMGLFMTNWKWGRTSVPWQKLTDGTMLLRIPGSGDEPIPMVHTKDTGNFVDALLYLPAGTNMLAFGDRLTWADYVKLWTSITGIPARFEKTTVEDHSKLEPADHSAEMAEMYGYMQDIGFEGGDPSVVYSRDVVPQIPCTGIADYIKSEDWTQLGDPTLTK